MSQTPRKLFLLDAMALIYRAYYALNKNPRITSKGLNTSAILGFANTLYEVIKNEKPDLIGVAFDTQAPTQRHIDFTAYKGTRESIPEDIAIAIPYIKKLISAFNIPILSVDGYEADDVIGTLAHKAAQPDLQVYMMTPDKDFGQLVDQNIFMYKPGKPGEKAIVMGVPEVCDKYSIDRPEQVKDILGLWGDVSDNIPGIPGVGEVTARKLISQFGTIENMVENASKIENAKLRDKVKEFGEQALMSKQLATIILDVPIEYNEEELKLTTPDFAELKTLLEELEFRNFGERVYKDFGKATEPEVKVKKTAGTPELSFDTTVNPETGSDKPADTFAKFTSAPDLFSETGGFDTTIKTSADIPHSYYLVDTPAKRKELIAILQKAGNISFDTETTGKDANNVELVGLSFAVKPGEAWYIPIPEVYAEACKIVQEFAPVYGNESIEKTGHNLKYDIAVLSWYDVKVKGKLFDTMIAHYLIEPDLRHGMDYLSVIYLKYSPISIETLIGKKGKDQITMREVPVSTVVEYASEDADVTLQLRYQFEPMLEATGTSKLFHEIEMPLVPVLAAMEAEGVKVDIEALKKYSKELLVEIQLVEKEIYQLAGSIFNIGSPRQLGEILFDRLKISEKPKQTKTKQYSTGEDVLVKLINKHPIVQLILDYRSLTKLKSTYIDSLPLLVNPRTGRIHTSYNQAVASTGRLSSNNPNLQNIPIRTERGREIRKAFVPRNQKFVLLSADYSQIELRIIAEISGDATMQEAFRQGLDIHTATAARIYNVDVSEVTREMRRNAKTVNFGIIYGISTFGLSERLNIPRKEAADIISQYFERFKGIRQYMNDTIIKARQLGYVETIMKRRRYVRDINSANSVVRSFAERNAINAPIQGSSADMIKIAMVNIYREFEQLELKSKMIMQVHDELVFDVLEEELDIVKPLVEKLMKTAMPLSIPIEVEISTGNNWLEAH